MNNNVSFSSVIRLLVITIIVSIIFAVYKLFFVSEGEMAFINTNKNKQTHINQRS